jgi:hypothetical protein
LRGLRLRVRLRLVSLLPLWLRLRGLRLRVRLLRRLSLRYRTLAIAPLVVVAARAIIIVRADGARSDGHDQRCTKPG